MASAKDHSKTKAAAMAHATRGRKTSFRSSKENRHRANARYYADEIEEALENLKKEQRNG